nr:MAG TPA: hypothetical protein [Caudoviricetes sp.]DAS25750.1 MAG TPA: hypothetical protein [Caudoviricetes sp.]
MTSSSSRNYSNSIRAILSISSILPRITCSLAYILSSLTFIH